jgi:hypothetical protein
MRFSDFDSYLRADHLPHATVVVIERFSKIMTRPRPGVSEEALLVHFRGKQKSLILSAVNRRQLSQMFGDNCSAAVGKQITLAVEQVVVAGTTRNVIRIKPAITAITPKTTEAK